MLKATTEQKNTELIRDTPEERQEINTIREHKNTDDSQIADTPNEIQNKDTEKNIEAIKTLEAIDLIASEEQKKTDGENPNSREARPAEKADEIETLGKTMLNATTEQKITKMQIPDPAEERQDKDGEGMEAQQKNPDEQRMDTTEKISHVQKTRFHTIFLTVMYLYNMITNPTLELLLIAMMMKYMLDACTGLGGTLSHVLFTGQKL